MMAICTLEGYATGPPGRAAFTTLALATLKLFTPASQGATVAADVPPAARNRGATVLTLHAPTVQAVFPAADIPAQFGVRTLDASEKQRYNPNHGFGKYRQNSGKSLLGVIVCAW